MAAARLDWSAIDPTIFGTLFESGLDEKKRAEMASLFDLNSKEPLQTALFDHSSPGKGVGIHYTDPDTIMKLIEPVVMRPLQEEWEKIKGKIRTCMERTRTASSPAQRSALYDKAKKQYLTFRERLGKFRVLDPACGSGNFLALTLGALKDFDQTILSEARLLDMPSDQHRVGPEAVLGIEINAYAAELARLTVWIAELQWQLRNSLSITRTPILDALPGIRHRDALVNQDGSEAQWPPANAIIGNPPFLGNKKMQAGLGEVYVARLRECYEGRLTGGVNLVCYWFEKSRALLDSNQVEVVGLVTTKTIRGGASRQVLDRICETGKIFEAWSDQKWVIKSAAVRVSLIYFCPRHRATPISLDGNEVHEIYPDLRSANLGDNVAVDLTAAGPLPENADVSFQGVTKGGPFEVPGAQARAWLQLPTNPNERPNSDVLRPMLSGGQLTKRLKDRWVITFGPRTQEDAAFYEAPFTHLERSISESRRRQGNWWKFTRARPAMFGRIAGLARFIVTPKASKYRFFCWQRAPMVPDNLTIVIARDDDVTFGILESKYHRLWALHKAMSLGVGNDPTYIPTETFETYPFPDGLTPNLAASTFQDDHRATAIAQGARRLDELRQRWLRPPELIDTIPEVVGGYPDRILPKNPKAADELKKRTMTNLYNLGPTWLLNAHRDLDAAVAVAYGWSADIGDDEALRQLLGLNLDRSSEAPAS
jgi:type II restriction/modification system DNA methylase subunit YeeA